MKTQSILGLVCFFLGLVLILIGCYVHWTIIADIPAAAMTARLEFSGWEWGAGAALCFFLTWAWFPK
jgi:hypothetical protein